MIKNIYYQIHINTNDFIEKIKNEFGAEINLKWDDVDWGQHPYPKYQLILLEVSKKSKKDISFSYAIFKDEFGWGEDVDKQCYSKLNEIDKIFGISESLDNGKSLRLDAICIVPKNIDESIVVSFDNKGVPDTNEITFIYYEPKKESK